MPALALGESSDCANPQLDIFTRLNVVLTDPFSIECMLITSLNCCRKSWLSLASGAGSCFTSTQDSFQ